MLKNNPMSLYNTEIADLTGELTNINFDEKIINYTIIFGNHKYIVHDKIIKTIGYFNLYSSFYSLKNTNLFEDMS